MTEMLGDLPEGATSFEGSGTLDASDRRGFTVRSLDVAPVERDAPVERWAGGPSVLRR